MAEVKITKNPSISKSYFLEPNELTLKYNFPFGNLGVQVKYRNKVFQILKNAFCPNLDSMYTVGWNNALFIGLQRTGKTNIINWVFDKIYETYPLEDINSRFTNSMAYNIENLEDVPYNLLATDDAIEHQDAYEGISKELRKLSHKFFKIRHILKKRFNRKTHSYILTILSFQMLKGLMKRLRQADFIFVTSIFSDEEENAFLRYFLGEDYFNFLQSKMMYISLFNDYSFNRYCILKTVAGTYFCDFPLAKSDRECLEIDANEKPRDIDFEIQEKLENRMSKSELYNILAYAYDPERDLKHIQPTEAQFIRNLHSKGIAIESISKLFHRHRHSIANLLKPQKIEALI